MNNDKYIPRNEDCVNCIFGSRDCGGIDFTSMKVVNTYSDGVKVVICTERE